MKGPADSRWRPLLLVPAAIVALVIAGCGGTGDRGAGGLNDAGEETPASGGTLRVAEYVEAMNLNPFEAVDAPSAEVFIQVIEPLYQTGSDGKAEPWLAESAEHSNDYKKWTLKLRKGVKFSDGKPLTAEDAAWSLEQIFKSESWKSMYEAVSEVKPVGQTTVEVQASKPFPGLPGVLALPFAGIVEKNYGGMSAKEFAGHPVGTGPFVLSSWKHGQSITLTKNPNYWRPGKPYLEKVLITTPASDEARALALKGEQVDLVASPPASQITELENTPGIRIEQSPLDLTYYLVLNAKTPLFENMKIREAINLAVDRDSYLKAAENGIGEVAGSFLPRVVDYWDSDIKPPERNVGKAKSLVAEAVAEGVDPKFSLMIASGDATSSLGAQIVQENLKDIGLEGTISPLDPSSKIEAELEGDFEMTIEGVSTDIVDPSMDVGLYVGSNSFFSQADSSKVKEMLNEATVEPDKTKLKQLYGEIQKSVAEEKWLLPLTYKPWVWAASDDVVGFQLNAVGLPFFADAGFAD